MLLQLQNNIETWTLDKYFKPEFSPVKYRLNTAELYSAPGVIITGDRNISERTVTLNYLSKADDGSAINDSNYRTNLNRLTGFFRSDLSPFYLIDTDNNIRTEIDLSDNQDTFFNPGLEYKFGNSVCKLIMLRSTWEDLTETNEDELNLTNEDTFEINIEDSYMSVYPEFTLSALNQVTEFYLNNLTNGHSFGFSNTGFSSGSELFISPRGRGTIELDGVDATNSLIDGTSFILLDPGVNTIQFQSSTGNVDINYIFRRRYLY